MALGDTIILRNGNVLTGRIIDEDDQAVVIHLGTTEVRVARSTIETIERGVAVDYVLQMSRRHFQSAEAALRQGNLEAARRHLESAQLQLEGAYTESREDVPAEIQELQEAINRARLQTVPPDPVNQEAERLFQRALRHVDHLEYRQAREILLEAVKLVPGRADLQMQLAEACRRLGRNGEAIDAYRAVLEADPETYYPRISGSYLSLLHQHGRRLLSDRRAEDAVPIYREILLLEENGRGPIGLQSFLEKRDSQDEVPEKELLMTIYRYADGNDLVDLAFAAATRAYHLDTSDGALAEIVTQSRFLSEFKRAVDEGKIREAASLLAQEPDLLASSHVAERVQRYSGDQAMELEAQRLYEVLMAAFADGEYETAADSARRLIANFGTAPQAREAPALLALAQLEVEVQRDREKAESHLDRAQVEQAEEAVVKLLGMESINQSQQFAQVRELESSLPMEKRAWEIWHLASDALEEERFDDALGRLEELANRYRETRAGRRATAWLTDYRTFLVQESRRYRPSEVEFLAGWTNPHLWRSGMAERQFGQPASIPDEHRQEALAAFWNIMGNDARSHRATTGGLDWIWFAAAGGFLLVCAMFWGIARPGKGKFVDPERQTKEERELSPLECRACGCRVEEDDLSCARCGLPTLLSEEEEVRRTDDQRRSNYDPWEVRVHALEMNNYDKHFEKAKDYERAGEKEKAIEGCRHALREDPHRIDGYKLLAELYEEQGEREQAAICYREILLLDPADGLIRQKLEASSAAPPIDPGPLPWILGIPPWWFLYFLTLALDPTWWHVRAGLAALGAVLTVFLFYRTAKHSFHSLIAKQHTDIDIHRPIPKKRLRWRHQNKQAKLLAEVIQEHTGVEVPMLSPWRTLWAAVLSLLLLGALAGISWVQGNPWALLAWPAGVFLLFYLLEIHPRVIAAHILLRHFMEETLTPWVDPHMPFRPKGVAKDVCGEFLITRLDQLPFRWALAPYPYGRHRQGILNSIQQTLNRHWAFHRFYQDARVVRDIDIPMPSGVRTTGFFTGVLVIGAFAAALALPAANMYLDRSYRSLMETGHRQLLAGDFEEARDAFFRASQHRPERVAPHLYAAHAFDAAGMHLAAERAYRRAVAGASGVAEAHNDFANFLQRQGRLEEALEQYEQALAQAPRHPDILNNAGSAYFKLQDYELARQHLELAASLSPRHTRAHTTLGLTFEALGDMEGARQAYERAVRHAPDVPYTTVARNRLARELAPEESRTLRLEISQVDPEPRDS